MHLHKGYIWVGGEYPEFSLALKTSKLFPFVHSTNSQASQYATCVAIICHVSHLSDGNSQFVVPVTVYTLLGPGSWDPVTLQSRYSYLHHLSLFNNINIYHHLPYNCSIFLTHVLNTNNHINLVAVSLLKVTIIQTSPRWRVRHCWRGAPFSMPSLSLSPGSYAISSHNSIMPECCLSRGSVWVWCVYIIPFLL